MAIELETPRTPGLPVVKRTAIGEEFVGMLIRKEQRNVLKDGDPVMNDHGKPKQELVLTVMTVSSTAPAGIGDHQQIPQSGEPVRLILRGKGFADWIQQVNDLGGPLQVGDVVTQLTESAQRYDANGKPTGKLITTQAELEAVPRGTSVGVYGPVTLRRSTAKEAALVAQAERLYHETAKAIVIEDDGDDAPF